MPAKLKTGLLLAAKLAILSTLLYYLYTLVDPQQVLSLLANISLPLFAAAVLFAVADQAVMGGKWHGLLRAFNVNVPIGIPIHAYFRGKLFELVAPSTLGIDAYKTVYVANTSQQTRSTVVSSIIVERFFGALSSLFLIGLTLWFSLSHFPEQLRMLGAAGGILGVVALLGVNRWMLNAAKHLDDLQMPGWLPAKIGSKLGEVVRSLAVIGERQQAVWRYLSISIIEKFAYGSVVLLCTYAVGGIEGLNPFYILTAIPLLALLERLPISFAAIGVREGLYVLLFAPLSSDPSTVVSIALAVRLVELVMLALLSFSWLFGPKIGLDEVSADSASMSH